MVSIFGQGSNEIDFVDSDFATKQHVDLTIEMSSGDKVSKSGSVMTGDLLLNVGTDTLRTLGCNDLNESEQFTLLLGDLNNQIRHNFGHSIKIAAVHGTKFTCPKGDIWRMGADDDVRTHLYQDVIMNNEIHCTFTRPI